MINSIDVRTRKGAAAARFVASASTKPGMKSVVDPTIVGCAQNSPTPSGSRREAHR